jgi:hypothetical protein
MARCACAPACRQLPDVPMNSAPDDSGFASSAPSSFGSGRAATGRSVRYRHRRHALALAREYRVGTHTLRWDDPTQPGRGAGQLALAQIALMRLQSLPGSHGTRRCRLTLQPHRGAAIVIDSDSAEGWFGRQSQAEGFRRFVRTLHAAALQVQPALRVEATPPPPLGGLVPGLLALTAAAALGMSRGPGWAVAALLLSWPLAAWAGRWQQARRAQPLPRGSLPRQLLP